MKRGLWIALLAICVCGVVLAQTSNVAPLRLTPAQYVQELDKWQQYIENAQRDSGSRAEKPYVPVEWVVQNSGGEYHVSTDFLRDLEDPGESKSALAHIQALRSAATASLQSSGRKAARGTADSILSRREFRGVRTPGIKESLADRAVQWLIKMIGKLFGKAVENAAGIRVFVTVLTWTLLLGGAAILFFWVFRALRSLSTPELALEGQPEEFVSAKPAETWLAEARQAAASGQYRFAICLAYWAAIAGLERAGAWRPDRARTPRAYLRDVPDAPFLPTLRSLTNDFERTWYANQPATADDFQTCIARVKELGWQ